MDQQTLGIVFLLLSVISLVYTIIQIVNRYHIRKLQEELVSKIISLKQSGKQLTDIVIALSNEGYDGNEIINRHNEIEMLVGVKEKSLESQV